MFGSVPTLLFASNRNGSAQTDTLPEGGSNKEVRAPVILLFSGF